MTPVFGVTGWKNSGKTTLVERLVSTFVGRGLRVSTVKHAHHEFDIDKQGTDSFRHRSAGATEVALVSGYRWAMMHELRDAPEPQMEDIMARLSPCDLVIIEGYKSQSHPKIEVRRETARKAEPLAPNDPNIVAIAADHPIDDAPIPVFDLDDVTAIADFIAGYLHLTATDR